MTKESAIQMLDETPKAEEAKVDAPVTEPVAEVKPAAETEKPASEQPPVEQPKPESPPANEKPALKSPEIAAHLKESRRILEERGALKRERAELEAIRKEAAETKARLEALKSNPRGVLSQLGVDDQTVLRSYMNPDDPQAPLKAELEQIKARLAAEEAARVRAQEEQQAGILKRFAEEVDRTVSADPRFELTTALGRTADVAEVIKQVYEQTGKMMTIQEAAEEVERTLTEQYLPKIEKLSKLQKKEAPPAPVPAKPVVSNSLTSSSGLSRSLTKEERRARAIALLG